MAADWPYSGAITPIGVEAMSTAWPNEIQDAIESLGAGGGRASLAAATAASSLSLPNAFDKTFDLTLSAGGPSYINYIETTNREPGNEIVLLTTGVAGTWYFAHNTASPPANYASILCYIYGTGATGISLALNMRLTLSYNGTNWICTV